MAESSPIPRLADINQAADLVLDEMTGVTPQAFERDIRKRWLVEPKRP